MRRGEKFGSDLPELVPLEMLGYTWGHGWEERHMIGDEEEPEGFVLKECVWISGHIMLEDGRTADTGSAWWQENYGREYGARIWTGTRRPTEEMRRAAPWAKGKASS